MNRIISNAEMGACASLFCLTPGAAAQINIVDAGRVGACIVVPLDPHVMVKEAADDLQQTVKQATGVRLPFFAPDDHHG